MNFNILLGYAKLIRQVQTYYLLHSVDGNAKIYIKK